MWLQTVGLRMWLLRFHFHFQLNSQYWIFLGTTLFKNTYFCKYNSSWKNRNGLKIEKSCFLLVQMHHWKAFLGRDIAKKKAKSLKNTCKEIVFIFIVSKRLGAGISRNISWWLFLFANCLYARNFATKRPVVLYFNISILLNNILSFDSAIFLPTLFSLIFPSSGKFFAHRSPISLFPSVCSHSGAYSH